MEVVTKSISKLVDRTIMLHLMTNVSASSAAQVASTRSPVEAQSEDIINSSFISNNQLTDVQFVFRQGHSASALITALIQTWSKQLDSRGEVRVTALDIKAGFDQVWHQAFYGNKNKKCWKYSAGLAASVERETELMFQEKRAHNAREGSRTGGGVACPAFLSRMEDDDALLIAGEEGGRAVADGEAGGHGHDRDRLHGTGSVSVVPPIHL
ncbi:uncharacterized protein [Heterodontus francisci]|uniref:uncharacterized protein n=1 Tax=Heterodontus francisci TaxID=7792 RepID=UPI00355B6F30